MRATGYILLIVGFLWLFKWCADSIVPLPRSIAAESFKKYHDVDKYSGTEVCDAIHGVQEKYKENVLRVVLPTTMMFVGGVLLDIASRRARQQNFTK
jgi:hypothetical protein